MILYARLMSIGKRTSLPFIVLVAALGDVLAIEMGRELLVFVHVLAAKYDAGSMLASNWPVFTRD